MAANPGVFGMAGCIVQDKFGLDVLSGGIGSGPDGEHSRGGAIGGMAASEGVGGEAVAVAGEGCAMVVEA